METSRTGAGADFMGAPRGYAFGQTGRSASLVHLVDIRDAWDDTHSLCGIRMQNAWDSVPATYRICGKCERGVR